MRVYALALAMAFLTNFSGLLAKQSSNNHPQKQAYNYDFDFESLEGGYQFRVLEGASKGQIKKLFLKKITKDSPFLQAGEQKIKLYVMSSSLEKELNLKNPAIGFYQDEESGACYLLWLSKKNDDYKVISSNFVINVSDDKITLGDERNHTKVLGEIEKIRS